MNTHTHLSAPHNAERKCALGVDINLTELHRVFLARLVIFLAGGTMLVDFIPAEKLPFIVVWIDWNFYAYWISLLVFSLISTGHYWQSSSAHSISGVSLSLFVGFCAWNVWCAIRYGYAVG